MVAEKEIEALKKLGDALKIETQATPTPSRRKFSVLARGRSTDRYDLPRIHKIIGSNKRSLKIQAGKRGEGSKHQTVSADRQNSCQRLGKGHRSHHPPPESPSREVHFAENDAYVRPADLRVRSFRTPSGPVPIGLSRSATTRSNRRIRPRRALQGMSTVLAATSSVKLAWRAPPRVPASR